MTSFVHVEQPSTHSAVARAEAFGERIRAARRGLGKFGGLAALLLAAMVSSVVVVADKLMSTWEDGGMVAAWAILWFVAFAAIAFFAGTARSLPCVRSQPSARHRVAARLPVRTQRSWRMPSSTRASCANCRRFRCTTKRLKSVRLFERSAQSQKKPPSGGFFFGAQKAQAARRSSIAALVAGNSVGR